MPNLSSLLEDSASQYADRDGGRPRRHPADLRPGRRRGQPGRQPARLPRHRARRQGGAVAARTCRTSRSSTTASSRPARRWCRSTCCSRAARSPTTSTDSDAKAYFCFEGTPELPIGPRRHARASTQADSCEHFFVITADPTAPVADRGHRDARRRRWPASRRRSRPARRRRRRHRGDPLHLAAPPASPRAPSCTHRNMRDERAQPCNDLVRRRRRDAGHLPVRAAAVPLVRPDRACMNAGFAYGGTLVLLPRFDADAALRR